MVVFRGRVPSADQRAPTSQAEQGLGRHRHCARHRDQPEPDQEPGEVAGRHRIQSSLSPLIVVVSWLWRCWRELILDLLVVGG